MCSKSKVRNLGGPKAITLIDYDAKERVCADCGELKPFSAYSPNGRARIDGSIIPRSNCKKCRSKKICYQEMEKKLVANPDMYLECDDCGIIQTRTAYQIKREFCRKCKALLDHHDGF